MNDATITPTDNGPEITDTIALCRCGLSATKPFCDGGHEKTYFKAVNRAPTSSSRMSPGRRHSRRSVTASTLAV